MKHEKLISESQFEETFFMDVYELRVKSEGSGQISPQPRASQISIFRA